MNSYKRFPALIPLFILLTLTLRTDLAASFRVPWQSFEPALDCPSRPGGRGYFRPEYVELAERLDPETLDWMARTYPVLGWQDMEPRLYRPKAVPGAADPEGFRYDTARRFMEMESLFHFGPLNGNGTLIEELLELDDNRLLSVNRGSRNLSVIDTKNPDVAGVIPAPRGAEAVEFNLRAAELYLVERNTQGLLIVSLKDYAIKDTLLLGFDPGAVYQSRDTRYLYFTDEAASSLVRLDLAGSENPLRIRTDLAPPYLLAGETESGRILLISRVNGGMRLFDGAGLGTLAQHGPLDGPPLAFFVPRNSSELFLAAGDCPQSTLYRLSGVEDGNLEVSRIVSLSGAVTRLSGDPEGNVLYALDGSSVFRLDPLIPGQIVRAGIDADLRDVEFCGDKVLLSGGLSTLYVLDGSLSGRQQTLEMEMGPGPLLCRQGKIYVANGLSNSITVLNARSLEEEVSVLVGVLLGRMVYQDNRVVVNNCFRGNLLVLDPDNFRIDEIVPASGGLVYSGRNRRYYIFQDSLAFSLPGPPSQVSMRLELPLPGGVRLFAQSAESPDIFFVADQNRYLSEIDLNRNMRLGAVALPDECRGLFVAKDNGYAIAPSYTYRFTASESPGLNRSWSVRAFKFNLPFMADEGFSRNRGSLLKFVGRDRLDDVFTTNGEIRVIRNDPDTTFTWIGVPSSVYVFDRRNVQQRSSITLQGPVEDICLPRGSANGYIATPETVQIIDRGNFFRYAEIEAGGEFVYAGGDDLFLRDMRDRRRLVVADGQRGMIFQELSLPLAPTDAATDGVRLFLLGSAEGALAIYVNLINAARLPRSPDRQAWDPDADRRAGFHR
ncbi:MAG: hypothetical protein A3F83_14795 [Candidatus Glassbacteria bacterium RIFCSPLOWO2_12_FULL_58_11]|uniref:Uncharacterized protein n=1 Tax=Candidatus Glassbacteria bacterium RIFCSPLOWO2_12_FULL_58_11 TaxID=1817867 RepID=A0A1F5YYS4_9BACT|nr:MAG: hypothetical protein A3F83_14795 [Candidatus Glassbacteria bacterium RIFCSPLOWO2_12_FULL_58_11]